MRWSRKIEIELRHLVVPLVILFVGFLAIRILVFTAPKTEPVERPERAPLVRVQVVAPEPIEFVVRAHGTVVPRRQGDLVPQVAGLVTWVSPVLASGGFFGEGEALLKIDPADYEVELEAARASVARAESEFDRSKKELARQKRLADRSVASETNYDDARNAERVAQAVLREARARLDRAQRDIERTTLLAPYTGRVRQADVDVGQFVARGAPIGKIYSVDQAEVRLPIADEELRFLDLPLLFREEGTESQGPEARLHARFAGEERSWVGRVVRTEGEIDPKTRMVHVIVRVEDPYGRAAGAGERRGPPLAVGLFVEAELLGRRVEDAVELPRSALRDETSVLVVDDDERMRTRNVEVLRLDGDRVVIGSGLAPGERVVVSPIQIVMEGMKVRTVAGDRRSAGEPDPPAPGERS
jgi:RND family efflux transporter MFP subunit